MANILQINPNTLTQQTFNVDDVILMTPIFTSSLFDTVVDDVEYFYEDMGKEQQVLVNHIADLDRKIGSSQFSLDQLNVGKSAFINLLKEALEAVDAEEVE